jgi:hypothetical protein
VEISYRRFEATYRCYLQGSRSEYWQFITDVSGQFGWENKLYFGFLAPEDGTDRLSRNVGKKLPLLDA